MVHNVPDSGGLQLHVVERLISAQDLEGHLPPGTRSVSVFLVNHRTPVAPEQGEPDLAYVFQPELEVRSDRPFVPRPDLRGARAAEWDEQVADLHYADTPEYATGHGVSAEWEIVDGACHLLRTAWIPSAEVEKTATVDVPGVELSMEALGALADGAAVEAALRPLVAQYRELDRGAASGASRRLQGARRETAEELLRFAGLAADRIERGIGVLAQDADALDAFRVANRAVARALRKRLGIETPRWRAFQLAFILLNLPGLADPRDPNRETVDLLFFPTGGGKTEAYLGLAAFAMVLRRLRHPGEKGLAGAGVSVIMRYTLRLLTLDQLARAAGLVCALELEREKDRRALRRVAVRDRPLGREGGDAEHPGRQGRRALGLGAHQGAAVQGRPEGQALADPARELPLVRDALRAGLLRAAARTTTSPASCASSARTSSATSRATAPLPIVAVDEPIYRRLPAFLIATVDKFASLPWVGQSGALLGGADTARRDGLLRRRGAGQGHAPRGAAAAARPRHPGRAAPDLGAARHDGRPLRGGDRGALRARDRRPRGAARRSSPRPPPCAGRRTRSRRSSRGRSRRCFRRPAPTGATPSSPRRCPPSEVARAALPRDRVRRGGIRRS